MRTIWKYLVESESRFSLSIPEGAVYLSAATQHGKPCMWLLVDPSAPMLERQFRCAATGFSIDSTEYLKYLATFQLDDGDFVLHLFEDLEPGGYAGESSPTVDTVTGEQWRSWGEAMRAKDF